MSQFTRRNFAKALAAAGAALPIVSAEVQGAKASPLATELADVVRAQSGAFLDRDDMNRVRSDFKDYVPFLQTLRDVKLVNSDEPDFTFAPLVKR